MAGFERPRVLLVEDAADVRRLLARFIRLAHADPVVAEDGLQGWELARMADPPFDLVITDSRMPRMTGRELIALLRERFPGIPILRITGSDGMSGLPPIADVRTLQKPFAMADFIDAVEALLASGR